MKQSCPKADEGQHLFFGDIRYDGMLRSGRPARCCCGLTAAEVAQQSADRERVTREHMEMGWP